MSYNKDKFMVQLIDHEGLRLKPYKDTVGKVTIGIGRNLDDRGISKAEAIFLAENDIKWVEEELDRNAPWWRGLNEIRQRVLLDMCFNLGWPRLSKFKKTLAAIKRGDFEEAAREMLDSRWARQVGRRATKLSKMMKNGT